MKLTDVGAPDRSFSRWLSDDEIGQVIAHKRGWRLAPDGRVIAGKILHRTIASSLAALGSAAVANRWASRPAEPRSDGSGPTHMMWGIVDARSDAEIAEQI
ncbi:hypothetical protein [Cryobacterium ruanii]|jgi:hypothetical protein|uniref:Uncharacterized protein n=1 Tax=Cryobacterium ruanii TaxID=1259197 RepID=A0A4R9AQC1_9MICO|nr:hypothetical protein [Cryobacterium ruanii]TFD67705.1 hypothetical protein E3T47_03485 [Cryobacterium ruanii]